MRATDYENGGYCRGGECDVTHEYMHEHIDLSKKLGVDKSRIYFLEHDSECEVCIYIDGKWAGYLSSADDLVGENGDNEWHEYIEWLNAHSHCDMASFDCPDQNDCPHKKHLTTIPTNRIVIGEDNGRF